MGYERTTVILEVNGSEFDWFTDWSISNDILNGAGGFRIHAPMLTKQRLVDIEARDLRVGALFKLYVQPVKAKKPVLCMTGYIDDVDIHTDRSGTSINVRGRDMLGDVVDSDVLPSIAIEGCTLGEITRRVLVDQFGFKSEDIITDAAACRQILTGKATAGAAGAKPGDAKVTGFGHGGVGPPGATAGGGKKLLGFGAKEPPAETPSAAGSPDATTTPTSPTGVAGAPNLEHTKVAQAKPQMGETAYAYLKRHAVRAGLLIWASPDGKIILGRPNFHQNPLFQFYCLRGPGGANVKSIDRRRTTKSRAYEVHVYSGSHGGDAMRAPIHAVAYDEDLFNAVGSQRARSRVLTIHDSKSKTQAQAMFKARFELSMRKQGADTIHVTTDDVCGDDGAVYAPDCTAFVAYDDGSVNDVWYVVSRTMTQSRGSGTETTLDLVPLYSIALGDGESEGEGGMPGVSSPYAGASAGGHLTRHGTLDDKPTNAEADAAAAKAAQKIKV